MCSGLLAVCNLEQIGIECWLKSGRELIFRMEALPCGYLSGFNWYVCVPKNDILLTGGCITSSVGAHSPCRQVPLAEQGVPSAQGRLPFLVEHWDVPSSWHHNWLQVLLLSEVLGQWANSSPNICWHCSSRLYLMPGSSLGNAIELSGTSSRQSPADTLRHT